VVLSYADLVLTTASWFFLLDDFGVTSSSRVEADSSLSLQNFGS